jgi:hypothetical protein
MIRGRHPVGGYQTLTVKKKLLTKQLTELRAWTVFGPKRDEVTGGCRKLRTEDLYDLYTWSSIIRIIKSRRMK